LVHFVEVFTLSESAAVDPTATVLGRLHREQRGLERCQLQLLVTLRARWRHQRVRLEHGSGHHAVSRDAWDRTSITDMNFQLCHACKFASNQASNKVVVRNMPLQKHVVQQMLQLSHLQYCTSECCILL
jgi:hypothetical protein